MHNAPEIFLEIPDTNKIYEMSENYGIELSEAVDRMDEDIFLDTMGEQKIERWEQILNITPKDDDIQEERRFRIKTKVLEKLPYSYNVLVNKLDTLCPDGYNLKASEDRTMCEVALTLRSQKMLEDVAELLDRILPLNMLFYVTIQYNSHELYINCTHRELSMYTYGELRERIFEKGELG